MENRHVRFNENVQYITILDDDSFITCNINLNDLSTNRFVSRLLFITKLTDN